MIDAGVAGAEEHVCACLASLGRTIEEVDTLLLTHAHPDHIGAAAAVKRLSGCKVYAPAREREWIEDIERQFRERPIPNFHRLLNEPVRADAWLQGGETIACGEGMTMRVDATPGHSAGSVSTCGGRGARSLRAMRFPCRARYRSM